MYLLAIIIVLIAIILLIDIIAIIVLIELVHRFALISVLLIALGSINVLQLQNGLKIWEIRSVLPCETDGWLTLRRHILPMLMSMKLQWDRVN